MEKNKKKKEGVKTNDLAKKRKKSVNKGRKKIRKQTKKKGRLFVNIDDAEIRCK